MKVAIVTGANRGLGYALTQDLCNTLDEEWAVYLTARNRERGENAVRMLKAAGLNPRFHILDVADDGSVDDFAGYIAGKYQRADIIISNAAMPITPDKPQSEQVKGFINTNNHGAYRMIKAFRPLLADGARFIVVASGFGTLNSLNPQMHGKFNIDNMSLEDVEAVMDEYVESVIAGTAEETGWGDWINIPSKVGQVASTKIFARDMKEEAGRRGILINSVCPGMMDTEASRPWFEDMSSAKKPEEASGDVIWLATLSPETREPYGELVQYRKIIPFK